LNPQPLPNSADPALPSTLRALFGRHNFRPRKRLGQHFLVVPQIADRILEIARISEGDRVLEIGAGAGALTWRLAKTASFTLALEVDSRLVEILAEIFPASGGLRLLKADILKTDLGEILDGGTWKVLGNLPYYITGPILAKLLEERRAFSSIVLMVQKEVAERIASPPGSKAYGALSVAAQAHFLIRKEKTVKRTAFYPQPEVDSAVISLTPRPRPPVRTEEEEDFGRLVKAAFSHRRKTLEKSLLEAGFLKSREEIFPALEKSGVGRGRRAESLSIEEFVALTRQLRGRDRGD